MAVLKVLLKPVATGARELTQTVLHAGGEATVCAAKQAVKQTPKLYSEASEKLLNKISSYFKRIPINSKVSNPVKINLEGNTVGFTMDRTLSDGRTKIILKDLLEEGTDFSASLPQQSSLQLILNRDGQLINGDLCTHLGFGVNDHVVFERAGKNIRRMRYAGTAYMPVGGDAHWVPVAQTQTTHASIRDIRGYLRSDAGRNNNLKEALDRSTFGELLMHLADLKTTL